MEKLQLKSQNLLILSILFCLPFYFVKLKYGWLSLNLIEILIIALFLIWVFDKKKKSKLLITNYKLPVSLIFAGLFFSVLVNENYYIGLGVIKGWFVFPIIFAVTFCDNLRKNEKLIDWSLLAIFFGGALVAIEGVYYWMSGLLTYDGRLSIFFDSPNQLAMCLSPVFLIGISLTQHPLRLSSSEASATRNTRLFGSHYRSQDCWQYFLIFI